LAHLLRYPEWGKGACRIVDEIHRFMTRNTLAVFAPVPLRRAGLPAVVIDKTAVHYGEERGVGSGVRHVFRFERRWTL
jgi:hypothetical protein